MKLQFYLLVKYKWTFFTQWYAHLKIMFWIWHRLKSWWQVHMFLRKCVLIVDVIWCIYNGSAIPNLGLHVLLPHLPRLLHHLPPPLPLREANPGRPRHCLLLDSHWLQRLCTLLLCEFSLDLQFQTLIVKLVQIVVE